MIWAWKLWLRLGRNAAIFHRMQNKTLHFKIAHARYACLCFSYQWAVWLVASKWFRLWTNWMSTLPCLVIMTLVSVRRHFWFIILWVIISILVTLKECFHQLVETSQMCDVFACVNIKYRKILLTSPGLIFVQDAFLLGLFSGEPIFKGAYYWKEFCISKWVWLNNKNS